MSEVLKYRVQDNGKTFFSSDKEFDALEDDFVELTMPEEAYNTVFEHGVEAACEALGADFRHTLEII